MTKPETLLDYGRRVAGVSDHIAEHLDDELDVERLAEVAHFSPWHFHRIYRETTGETVADTVRRLRLHRAAVDLSRDDDPLERVAKRAGFREWLPKSGEEAGDHACFEEYLNNPRDLPPSEWLTRISLPLKD
jgi:AraC-like DNA-binding protein